MQSVRRAFLRVVRASVVILLGASPLLAQETPPKQEPDVLHQLNSSLQALSRKISPAVVQILVTSYGPVNGGKHEDTAYIAKQQTSGSGFVLDSNGYVITNAHVVAGAQRVRVVVSPVTSGSTLAVLRSSTQILGAKIVGQSREMDIALLKIEATGLPVLHLGDYYRLHQGQIVLALGSPEGLENSVSMGVISSVARQVDPDQPMIFIQTDAPINPGNSGGPLVDVDGNVVGMNTFILTQGGGSEGLGFAIPSAVIGFAFEQLKKTGHVHRGHIGAVAQAITPDMAIALDLPRNRGVIIADVLPEGPAEKAGLRIEDVVVSMDGRPVQTFPQFETFLFFRELGDRVKVEVLRGSERIPLEIEVAPQRDELEQLADVLDPQKNLVQGLGIVGVEIGKNTEPYLHDLRIGSGVIVAGCLAGGACEEIGLRAGDIIHKVNRTAIDSLQALRVKLEGLRRGTPVVLQVERDEKLSYMSFQIE